MADNYDQIFDGILNIMPESPDLAKIALSQNLVEFGGVFVNEYSEIKNVEIENMGIKNLNINYINSSVRIGFYYKRR